MPIWTGWLFSWLRCERSIIVGQVPAGAEEELASTPVRTLRKPLAAAAEPEPAEAPTARAATATIIAFLTVRDYSRRLDR